jgi:poly-D-alanine transfer protein DltD
MSQDLPPISDGNSHMHIGWQGWVTAGKTIDLSVYHPLTGKTLSLQSLQLSAAMLREA